MWSHRWKSASASNFEYSFFRQDVLHLPIIPGRRKVCFSLFNSDCWTSVAEYNFIIHSLTRINLNFSGSLLLFFLYLYPSSPASITISIISLTPDRRFTPRFKDWYKSPTICWRNVSRASAILFNHKNRWKQLFFVYPSNARNRNGKYPPEEQCICTLYKGTLINSIWCTIQ